MGLRQPGRHGADGQETAVARMSIAGCMQPGVLCLNSRLSTQDVSQLGTHIRTAGVEL